MADTLFDVIVMGAGPTGENVADRVVQGGLTAVIIESNLAGGECSYYACIPSKVLLRSAAAVEEARRVEGAKQAVTGSVDAAAVLARRTSFTESWKDDSQVKWVHDHGVAFLRGEGRIAGERIVEVRAPDGSVTRLTARHAVVVCTGTSPQIPSIPGLAEASPWTNREATHTDRIPPRFIVLGGGPVGCELAQAFHSLGSKQVTLIDREPHLLQRFEPFVGGGIAEIFRDLGISVHSSANVTRVQRQSPSAPV